MELHSPPEEPTSVIQIMGEFDEFLTGGRSRKRTDRPRLRIGRSSDVDQFQLNFSQGSGLRDREQEVELLASKAKIAKLENQLKSFETEQKIAKIEQEREAYGRKQMCTKKNEEEEELRKRLKYLLEKDEENREEISALKKKYDSVNEKYTRDIDSLMKEKERWLTKMEEIKESHRREITSLRSKLNENGAIILQNRAEEAETQLNLMKSKLSKLTNVVKMNEELISKLHSAEHRCMVAEEELSRQDEAVKVAKAMQNQMTKLKELERNNVQLKEENKLLRDSRDNAMLLQEKYDSMKAKCDNAVNKLDQLALLEIENEELKKRMSKWEVEETPGGTKKARSPTELSRMISDLQKSQLSMMEKHGDLVASVSIKDSSLQSLTEKYNELKDKFLDIEEKEKQQAEKCSRLQRRLLLVTTDRDGIRRILNNYDTEISPNYSPQLLSRVKEAEERANSCNEAIDKLENELNEKEQEKNKYRLQCGKLEAKIEQLNNQQNLLQQNKNADSQSKSQMEDLKTLNEKLQQKVDILEARIEQRHLQGDFDPTKTKVVHFAGNPLALSRKLHLQEFEKLKEENDDLHRKIRQLEQLGGSTESKAIIPSQNDRATDKEKEDLKSQLESSELQNKRLKEVFTSTVKAFRESCYHLFGYQHDMIGTNKFSILSMYAERPCDKFIFQSTQEGGMQMIETEFSSQFQDAINTYLQRGSSIPAFLSNVTLELFSRQTQIQNTSLAKIASRS